MRLVTGILALTLFASFARAEDTRTTEPAESAASAGSAADVIYRKVPLRVVRIMAQSHQALLFDRSRATHVLAAEWDVPVRLIRVSDFAGIFGTGSSASAKRGATIRRASTSRLTASSSSSFSRRSCSVFIVSFP